MEYMNPKQLCRATSTPLSLSVHGAYNLIPINVWQRLDDVVHRAGATREGGDSIEYRGGDRRHGWLHYVTAQNAPGRAQSRG
jgi:hypothetical protein